MRYIALSLLVLGLALLSSAGNPAFSWDALANGRIDWGQPPWPVDEIAYPAQVLPHAAGWFHYLSRGEEYSKPLAAGGGYVLTQDGHELLALTLQDGAEAWRIPCDPYITFDQFAAGSGMFFHSTTSHDGRSELTAWRADDGTTAWRQPGLRLLGTAPGGVWATLNYEAKRTVYSSLRLLAADSGKVLQAYDLPPDYAGAGWVWKQDTDKWPVLSKKSVRLAYTDGRVVELPRQHPDWDAYLGLAADALVLCENPPYVFSFEREKPGAPPPQLPVVCCYSLPDGAFRWQREDLPGASPQYGLPFFAIEAGAIVFAAYGELDVVDLHDGATKYRWTEGGQPGIYLGSAKAVTTGQGVLYLNGYNERESCWYRLDLAGGGGPLPQPEFNDTVEPQFALDGWLICNAGHFQWGGGPHTSALLALRLGPEGAPQAGALDMSTPQPDYSALTARFLASPAPLEDDALMRDIAAQGINAVLALLPATPPERAEHLDALLAETIHLYHMDMLRRGEQNELRLFFSSLQRLSSPAYSPALLRWLKQPELSWLPDEARITLADCGGSAARDYLCASYDAREVRLHAAPPAPYQLSKPNLQARTFYPDKQEALVQAGLWAQVETGGGVRYALFPAPGLRNERDLYVACDTQGDGLWDWVLPTGLQDVFYEEHVRRMYGSYHMPQPPGVLELGCLGDTLRISHNRPVPGQANPAPEGELLAVEFIADKLPLSEIRQDSDGDGLTDIIEAGLLTDPHDADTDRDGSGDAQDATPNVDAARMGAVARGISRAMAYFYSGRYPASIWWLTEYQGGPYVTGQPWQARYFIVDGCGAVACCGSPEIYGVCISTPEQWARYRSAASGIDNTSLVLVNWAVRDGKDGGPAGGLSYNIINAGGLQDRPRTIDESSLCQALEEDPAVDMIVSFDSISNGNSIELTNVDGEYIPIGYGYSWCVD
jgi:hypothetical protein